MSATAPTVGVSSTHPSDMPEDHASLPVWNAENWFYEDWPAGQRIRSLRRTMAEGDSHMFNMLVTDIHPYAQDEMFAEREGIFGKRLIAGIIDVEHAVPHGRPQVVSLHAEQKFKYVGVKLSAKRRTVR